MGSAPDAHAAASQDFSFLSISSGIFSPVCAPKTVRFSGGDVVGHDGRPCHQNNRFFSSFVRRLPASSSSMIAFAFDPRGFAAWFSFME